MSPPTVNHSKWSDSANFTTPASVMNMSWPGLTARRDGFCATQSASRSSETPIKISKFLSLGQSLTNCHNPALDKFTEIWIEFRFGKLANTDKSRTLPLIWRFMLFRLVRFLNDVNFSCSKSWTVRFKWFKAFKSQIARTKSSLTSIPSSSTVFKSRLARINSASCSTVASAPKPSIFKLVISDRPDSLANNSADAAVIFGRLRSDGISNIMSDSNSFSSSDRTTLNMTCRSDSSSGKRSINSVVGFASFWNSSLFNEGISINPSISDGVSSPPPQFANSKASSFPRYSW